jgi:hypothetical protein
MEGKCESGLSKGSCGEVIGRDEQGVEVVEVGEEQAVDCVDVGGGWGTWNEREAGIVQAGGGHTLGVIIACVQVRRGRLGGLQSWVGQLCASFASLACTGIRNLK